LIVFYNHQLSITVNHQPTTKESLPTNQQPTTINQ